MSPAELAELLDHVARPPEPYTAAERADLADMLGDGGPELVAETDLNVVWVCNLVGHAPEGRPRHLPKLGPCLMGRCARCGVGWLQHD